MKKRILTALAMVTINFYSHAQYANLEADPFRSLLISNHAGRNERTDYLTTTNKTTMKKTIIMATLISAAMTVHAQTNTNDEDAIRTVVKTMETGWNEKSGEKYASIFADTHDFIVWNGYYFPNQTRQGTAAAHQNLFTGIYKNSDVELKVDKIKFIRKDIALVHTYGGMYEKGKQLPENPGVLMTLLMEKKDAKWQIISFHNLDLEGFQDKAIAERSPFPFSVMYAGWYNK
ncbi:MAG: SgcJ/EcaC family oxidoreductase [Chitinophagaceae bacterium]